MSVRTWLHRITAPTRAPLTQGEARAVQGFDHVRVWTCQCGARLRIRAREPRGEGPSNFQGVYTWDQVRELRLPERYVGHSIVPSGSLNWNGLAAERGWHPDPVRCPACQAGFTHGLTPGSAYNLEAFKAARRAGRL